MTRKGWIAALRALLPGTIGIFCGLLGAALGGTIGVGIALATDSAGTDADPTNPLLGIVMLIQMAIHGAIGAVAGGVVGAVLGSVLTAWGVWKLKSRGNEPAAPSPGQFEPVASGDAV